MQEQLLTLVWRGVKIDHLPGDHDDFANAAAGAIWLAAEAAGFDLEGWARVLANRGEPETAPDAAPALPWHRSSKQLEAEATPEAETDLMRVYQDAYAKVAIGSVNERAKHCARCGELVEGERVTDFKSVWHRACQALLLGAQNVSSSTQGCLDPRPPRLRSGTISLPRSPIAMRNVTQYRGRLGFRDPSSWAHRSLPKPSALAACAELERQSADGAASWARDPTKELDIPSEETVAEARRNLAQKTRLADAARAALPAMIAAAQVASVPHTQAVRLVVEAVHGELCAEAEKIRAEQLALEQRTRELCERLIAIGAVLRANPVPGAGSGCR